MSEAEKILADLSPAQRQLVLMRIQERRRSSSEHHEEMTIRRQPSSQPSPLSFAQRRMWFLDQLHPGSPAYVICCPLRLAGSLDVTAVAKSLAAIVERHEVLRTSFAMVDGEPLQSVHSPSRVSIARVQLSELPVFESEIDRILRRVTRQSFELSRGPLLRALLIRIREDLHVLVLVMHHIITDAWSIGIFQEELSAFYQFFTLGREPGLSPLPIQYRDYAVWQRQLLSGKMLDEQLSHWRQQLAGVETLHLPTDHPRKAVPSFEGATASISLTVARQLEALGQSHDATMFMVLLAGFKILLARYTSQDDLAVGTPIANRTRLETEKLIGFFVNTLVLRTDLSGNLTTSMVLRRVRRVALGAYSHQDLPFEQLVEELQPERDLSHHPLFQVMFVLQQLPRGPQLPNLELTTFDTSRPGAPFDLTLLVEYSEDRLRATIEYSIDLFEAETIHRMLGHLRRILEGMIATPDCPIRELPILTEAERSQLLEQWNRTAVAYSAPTCVHQLFEAQAQQTPSALAASCEGLCLTYDELNRRANQLAHYLRRRGVRPEARVGICLERSLEMVISLLGILKAGGAYVPLDPSYPGERLAFMVKDAQIDVLITTEAFSALVPRCSAHRVWFDRDGAAISVESQIGPDAHLESQNLAYIIYTSGSTGQPKGSMNTHEAVCNRLLWMQDSYRLDSSDRVLQKTPFSFDVSVWEFFWPLLAGAALVVARPGGHWDNSYLKQVISTERITTVHFVPSMLRSFLEDPDEIVCSSLKRVISSGESLDQELQRRTQERLNVDLFNLYGPTEATVDVTYWRCRQDWDRVAVPIGRPISNTQIYLLDRLFQPVPVGVVGELYIAGVNLARGYSNRPDLTGERFLPNPFGQDAGARMYRTGDLGRFLADGNIELVGRCDHQIKLRGFRIELGEVEAALESHPSVCQTLVVVREDQPNDKRLIAYVVSRNGPSSSSELRGYLRDRLPEYMVPAAFVHLQEFPLTCSGKVDRRQLPSPHISGIDPCLEGEFPESDAERKIKAVWQEVLGITQIGLRDNFFDLGGHSLLLVRVHQSLRAIFPSKLSLLDTLKYPTIASLAAFIVRQGGANLSNITDACNPSD